MPAKTKALTLPSGATCTIHAPSRFTDMRSGYPPQTLQRNSVQEILEGTPAAHGRAAVEGRPLNKAEIEWLAQATVVQLVHCSSPIKRPDGTTAKLVDKPFYELKPGELCIDDLSQADAELLSAEIAALREEAAAQVATFPAHVAAPETGTADARRDGETVRQAAQPDCAAAGG